MMAFFFNHVWQSTLFAGVIAILAVALRHNRARLRYGLWLAASVKFLVPFATLAAAGGLVEWQQAPASIRSIVAAPAVRDFNAPFEQLSLDPTVGVAAAEQQEWIARVLFTVWVCGFAAIVLRRMRQWREIRAAVRASTPFPAATPVPAGIEIRTAPTVHEPFGLFIPTPQRFEFNEVAIGVFLRHALQKPDYQMIGAPGWIDTERYTIMAKPPEGTPPAALTTMMVNLLKDRFQLATHLETRELPIFNLVMARTDGRPGPNLKATPADCQATIAERNAVAQAAAAGRGAPPPLPGMPGGPPLPDFNATPTCGFGLLTGNVAVSGRTIAQFATTVSEFVGRPVIDKTGLTGLYDFTLKFAPEGRHAGPLGPTLALLGAQVQAPSVDPDAPSLATALQEQLGLKLETARGPVEVVVIDRLEKPTPD